MRFAGWQKTSLIEVPGRVATVLFTSGCNLRCPWCYNARLALGEDGPPGISDEEVLGFLSQRKRYYGALMVSGGEPTLHAGLTRFLRSVAGLGVPCALATNGTGPDVLASLLGEGLLQFVAIDVKGPPDAEAYARSTGARVDVRPLVERSLALLREAGIDHEVRMTVVPALHRREDVLAAAAWAAGAPRLALQPFRPGETLVPDYGLADGREGPDLEALAREIEPMFSRIEVRT